MKKISILLLLLLFNNQLFAANSPEDTCIASLSLAVKNDSRFNNPQIFKNNNWLVNVLYNETNNSYFDISNYSNFNNYTVINPASTDNIHQNLINNHWFTNKDFIARRTNIATVVTANNFVISNILWFWRDSNFDFPLSAESWTLSYWDPYKLNWSFFKEYVVYTHHSYKGDFLSCGIVHIKPLGIMPNWQARWYGDISESWYDTNVLTWNNCNSWFQWWDISKNNYTFYKMKTNVCVQDYTNKDYLKMEVISIAYKNWSSYFSDYVAHNLQVQAMKDLTNQTLWLYWIRQIFLRYLHDWTCLKLLHTGISDLPWFCNWTYSSNFNLSWIDISDINSIVAFNYIEKNNYAWLFNMFLPSANAFRKLKNMDTLTEKARWIMVLDSMPYNLYIKLQSIKDESFRNYLIYSISPNLEDLIKNRRKQWIIITPYEDIFLKCNIKYSKRNEIVIDLLKRIKDPNNIDFSNLTYLDPKFWNCIIPYPDKSNLKKEIDLSFSSNKLLAKKLKWIYQGLNVSEDMLKIVENEKKLNIEYENKVNDLTNKFNKNIISWNDFTNSISNEKKLYNQKLNNLYEKKKKIEINNKSDKNIISKEVNKELKNIDKKNSNFDLKTIWIIIFLLIVWIMSIFISIKKKK